MALIFFRKAEQWITVHPNGPDSEGQPVLVRDGTIVGGAGGNLNGKKLSELGSAHEAPSAHSGKTRAERISDRQERLDSRADKFRGEAKSAFDRANQISERFSGGQPIILQHHSTKGAFSDRAKMDSATRRGLEASDKAKDIESTSPSNAILVIDADAPDLIRQRIAKLEADQEKMKRTNTLARNNDLAGLAAMGYSEKTIAGLMKPDWGKPGVPDYMMTNNSANIRRLRERLPKVEAAQSAKSSSRMVGDVKVEEDAETQRIRLHFPGKPSPEIIAKLKANGFRWAPSEGAWQRQLTDSGKRAAKDVLGG